MGRKSPKLRWARATGTDAVVVINEWRYGFEGRARSRASFSSR